MGKDILVVKNLSVELGKEKIIENLSFSVERRESMVVLGPNGAGKTTLLRALVGIVPYKGEVKWGTENISYLPPQELVRRRGLFPLTVEDFFSFKEVAKDDILETLDSVGLESKIVGRKLSVLSTGQFQRLLIAWALVDKPEVLLFDEPTSGIDVGGQETIYSLLHKFWEKRDLTIILVTHDLNVVWEHANHVLCLNKTCLCLGRPDVALTPKKLRQLYGVGLKFHRHIHADK